MIGKLLGIDHGLARIGIAVSDALGVTARELQIIERTSREEDFERIKRIAHQENVIALVVGIPYNEAPDGVHKQEETVRLWITRLRKAIDLPIIEWDEQLSSQEAQEIAKRMGRSTYEHIDDLAARIILQRYLDAVADGLTTLPPRP